MRAENRKRFLLGRRALQIIAALAGSAFLAIGALGYFGIWTRGMDFFTDNRHYVFYEEIDTAAYSVELDLTNPERNAGKVLYEKDGCRIVVEEVCARSPGGGYEVTFVSSGAWNRRRGVLVSIFSQRMELPLSPWPASANCRYDSRVYECEQYRSGGPGADDRFTYAFFPDNQDQIPGRDAAVFTLQNLRRNVWARK